MDIVDYSDDEEFLGGGNGIGIGHSTRLGSSQRGRRHLTGSASESERSRTVSASARRANSIARPATDAFNQNLATLSSCRHEGRVSMMAPLKQNGPRLSMSIGAKRRENERGVVQEDTNRSDGRTLPDGVLVPNIDSSMFAETHLPLKINELNNRSAIKVGVSDSATFESVAANPPTSPKRTSCGNTPIHPVRDVSVAVAEEGSEPPTNLLAFPRLYSESGGVSVLMPSANAIRALRESELTEEDKIRHRYVLHKRNLLGQPTGYYITGVGSGAGTNLTNGEGDLMRKSAMSLPAQLSASESQAREVLGVNNTGFYNFKQNPDGNTQFAANHQRLRVGSTLLEGSDALNPVLLSKFRKKGRHMRGMESVRSHARKSKRREDGADFTSTSEEDVPEDNNNKNQNNNTSGSPPTASQDAVAPTQTMLKALKKDVLHADMELKIRQYRPEHRSLPDEGGRIASFDSNGDDVVTSQRPFAAIKPATMAMNVFGRAPKSSKPGGGAFGAHMTFAAAIFTVLFCVKIKGCLGHETRHEIQRAFEKEANDANTKRLNVLTQIVSTAVLCGEIKREEDHTVKTKPEGCFVTPRNAGAPSNKGGPDKLPPPLTRRKAPAKHNSRNKVDAEGEATDTEDGGETSDTPSVNSPRITARGALLAGRQQFAELKQIMTKAVAASAQRMQHAKKQLCSAQIAKALGDGGAVNSLHDGCHHHRHHMGHGNAISPRRDVNPFSATTLAVHKDITHRDTVQPTPSVIRTAPSQLSEYLFAAKAGDSSQKGMFPNPDSTNGMAGSTSSAPKSIHIPAPPFQLHKKETHVPHTRTHYQVASQSSTFPNATGGGSTLQSVEDQRSKSAVSVCVATATDDPCDFSAPKAGESHPIVGQRNFYVLHNGWADLPFSPPTLVQAADYVPQARESKLRVFTRPESPLLPVIERLGLKAPLVSSASNPVSPKPLPNSNQIVLQSKDSVKRGKKGILRKDMSPSSGGESKREPSASPLKTPTSSLEHESRTVNELGAADEKAVARVDERKRYLQGTAATELRGAPNPNNKSPRIPCPPANSSMRLQTRLTMKALEAHARSEENRSSVRGTVFSSDRAEHDPLVSDAKPKVTGIRFSTDHADKSPESPRRMVPTFVLPRQSVASSSSQARKKSGTSTKVGLRFAEPTSSARGPPRKEGRLLAKEKMPLSARSLAKKEHEEHQPLTAFSLLPPDPFAFNHREEGGLIRPRAGSMVSNASGNGMLPSFASPTFSSSRRGSVASNRSFNGGGSMRSGGGTLMSMGVGGSNGFEDLAARKPHGKSQVESQREMMKEHKKKRASFIDPKTNIHIQWRKETVAERIAKDYDFTTGGSATYEAFRTANFADHNAFLARAAEEMRRVLQVREETSFPIKARTLVAAVENVEKTRLRAIRKERRSQRRKAERLKEGQGGSDADASSEDEAVPFDSETAFSTRKANKSISPAIADDQGDARAIVLRPATPPSDVLRTIDPAVSVGSAIRSVEGIITGVMRDTQMKAIKAYNSVWVDKVRASILPYADEGGFTASEEKVFKVFRGYLVKTGGSTGISGATSDHNSSMREHPSHGGGLSGQNGKGNAAKDHSSNTPSRRGSVSSALPTIASSSNLKRLVPLDPVTANQRLFRKVLAQHFTVKELEEPNVQFLIMRMLPLFTGLTQNDVVNALRDRQVPFHLVTKEFEAIFSPYVADPDDAHRRLKERQIDRHLAFHANVARRLDRVERLVRAEKNL